MLKHLLRDGADEAAFLERYADRALSYLDRYEAWFVRRFPLYCWEPLPLRPGAEEFTIGMLCLLYRRGRVNLSFRFSSSGTIWIQHEALTVEEYRTWAADHYRQQPVFLRKK